MNKWISVEDRLPEQYYHGVLVWVENENGFATYAIGFILEDDPDWPTWYEWMSDEPMSEFGYTVIAWQELPDEYREER